MAVETLSPDYRHEAVTMAIAIVVDRIRRLPKEDRDDLYELLNELPGADCEEEQENIVAAMREILDQASVASMPLSAEPSSRLQNWMEYVGGKIKKLREERGWTQIELSEKSGLPQSHICRIEKGVHSPTRMTLEKLASAFEIDVGQLDPHEP